MNAIKNLLSGKYTETWGASATQGPKWATNSSMFVPIPNTRIDLILKKEELVRFEGRVIEYADGGVIFGDLGIGVDGVYYTGDQYPTVVPMGMKDIEHRIEREFRLPEGAHHAHLVFRRRESCPSFASIHMTTTRPAELEAGY